MLTDEEIRALFLVLHAGGCRQPEAHRAPNGLDAAVSVYALTLDGLSFDEVQAASFDYLRSACPFWPTPGQLIDLVPDMAKANASHRALTNGKRPSLLEAELTARVGLEDAAAYCQAYRAAWRVLREMAPEERQAIGTDGRPLPAFSNAFLSRLPKLLTTNQEPSK